VTPPGNTESTFLNTEFILRQMHVLSNFFLRQYHLQCKQSCQSSYTATYTELFCNISLVARGHSLQSRLFCFAGLA